MRYFIPLLAVLLTCCNADPVPTGKPHEADKITAYFDFDTTGWVMQDKEEVAQIFNLMSSTEMNFEAKDVIAAYGRSNTIMEHPFFIIFDVETGHTTSIGELEKALGIAPIDRERVKNNVNESLGDLLDDMTIGKPFIDHERNLFVVRGQNPTPDGLIQTISTNFLVRNGMINMTGAYVDGDDKGLIKAYEDIVESFAARRK